MSAHLYALLVGIDAYTHPSLPPLRGCVNDVHAMREVLEKDFAVPPDQVVELLDEQATRDGIEEAFTTHLEAAGQRWRDAGSEGPPPGFLFFFSGHGSQAEDPTGVEPDGLDETLVPVDGREDAVFDIKDFELASWLRRLPGDDVTVVLDCCHSGSGTRSPARRAGAARAAPMDHRPQPSRRPAGLGPTRGVSLDGSGKHVLLAACSDHQQAFEYVDDDGRRRGRFSFFLVPQLAAAAAERDPVTYRDLHDRVWLDVAADAREQRPQCEGDVDRILFSHERLERSASAHVLGVRDGLVWTDVGRVHGVAPGTLLVAPTAEGGEVTVEVQRVEPVRCAGPVRSTTRGAPTFPARGRRAKLGRLDLGPRRWRLRGDTSLASLLRDAVDESGPLAGAIELVADPAQADLHASMGGAEHVLTDAAGRRLVAADDGPSFVVAVAHVARYAWLLDLQRDDLGPDMGGRLSLVPLVVGTDDFSGEVTATPLESEAGAGEVIAGQRLAFELRNETRLPLQVGLLAFTADWRVTVLHPLLRGSQDQLGAGRSITIGRLGSSFAVSLPEGVDEAVELLRLIGTTHATSFEPLAAVPPSARWGVAGRLPVPPAGRADLPPEPLLPRRGRRAPSRWLSTTVELAVRA